MLTGEGEIYKKKIILKKVYIARILVLHVSKLFIFVVATNRMKKENFYYIINSLLYIAIIHKGWNHIAGIFIHVPNYEYI